MGFLAGYRASHFIKMATGIPSYYVSIMVGLLLSDGSISVDSFSAGTARITFAQSIIHFPYLWHV